MSVSNSSRSDLNTAPIPTYSGSEVSAADTNLGSDGITRSSMILTMTAPLVESWMSVLSASMP